MGKSWATFWPRCELLLSELGAVERVEAREEERSLVPFQESEMVSRS